MELINQLKEIGLSSKESEVYLGLLESGQTKGGDLARKLNMDRSHTYNVLKNLIRKGLVNSIVKREKTFFQANNPKNLLNDVTKKERIIQSILPELNNMQEKSSKEPVVKILEGKSGLRSILADLLDSRIKNIYVFGATGKSYDHLRYEISHLTKKTKSVGINGKIITSSKLKDTKFTKLPNFKIRYIKELTSTSTMIFGNKVSINIFENNPTIILIDSKSVADSYKRYFQYLWKQARY